MKMKNNKILSRLLALSAVLVLVSALAIPCFADAPAATAETSLSPEAEEFFNSWSAYTYITDINLRDLIGDQIFDYKAVSLTKLSNASAIRISAVPQLDIAADYYIKTPASHIIYSSTGSDISVWYDEGGSYDLYLTFPTDGGDLNLTFTVNVDGTFNLYGVRFNNQSYEGTSFSEFVIFLGFDGEAHAMNDLSALLGGFEGSVAYPAAFYDGYTANSGSDGGSFVPTAKTGMFGQLYYILKDAIYGENAVIGTTQDFILSEIATITVYAFVLMPLLIGVVFFVRIFRG